MPEASVRIAMGPVASDRRSWLDVAVFGCLAIVISAFHEPWRDEYQALLLGRAANSISEVVTLARYEGHPSLWYMLLHLLPHWGIDVVLAKLLNLACIIPAAALLLLRAPFPWRVRVLLCLGYFMIYEYAAFFRNYAMAVLLTFLAIAWMSDRNPGRRSLAILPLMVLPFTQIYGLLLSMALFGSMVALRASAGSANSYWRIGTMGALYFGALALAIVDIKPPADGSFYGEWGLSGERLLSAMGIPAQVFLPLPPFRVDHWNKWLLDGPLGAMAGGTAAWTRAVLSLLIMTAAAWSLRRSRAGLLLFLGTAALVLAFCALRFHGNLRHHGMIFIAFIGAHWLALGPLGTDVPASDELSGKWHRRGRTLVLLAHVWAGLFAVAVDVLHPFSNATALARRMHNEGLADRAILAHAEHCGISIAGALGRPIHYPGLGRAGTYIPWNNTRRWGIPFEEYLAQLHELDQKHPGALLLTSDTLPTALVRQNGLRELLHGSPAIQRDETFALYSLER